MRISHGVSGALLLCAASAAPLQAQQLFTTEGYLHPAYRGATGTEYSRWENFFFPYLDPNEADVDQALSNPTIIQDLADSAFTTSGINIYTPEEKLGLKVYNNVSSTIGASSELKNLVFQFETLGTGIDLSTIKLNYMNGTTAKSISALNMISEYRIIVGGYGGFAERVALQWDLTGLGITNYTISFESYGSSSSFSAAVLDPSVNAYTEVVASARTWDGGGGNSLWSTAANWSGDTLTTIGGNVTLGSSSPTSLTLDSSREVGQLNLLRAGNFALTASNGATLKINTGIVANAGTTASYQISAPIYLGGHNIVDVAAGTTLELSNTISGAGEVGFYPATGIYKTGDGTLRLSGTNTFLGGVSVDGGRLIMAGLNDYTGNTSILSGELVVQADAVRGPGNTVIAGSLGKATTNIALGVDPATYGNVPAASLVIDGNYTIARNIALSSGTNTKILSARNTSGAGATFSGNLALGTLAENVILRAEAATDVVSFTGNITGAAAANPVTKDGLGTVIYAGNTKNYSNATVIAAGSLQVAAGTSFTGNGAMTVASGAKLIVHGSLSGTGALNVNGGTVGGSGTISRTLSLDTGDVLAPGNDIGTLHTIGQTWGGGATLKLEMYDVDAGIGTGWDNVDITGSLSLTASAGSKFKLQLTSLTSLNAAGLVADFNANTSYSWQFLTASGGITGFNANAFQVDTSGTFLNSLNGSFTVSMSGDGKSLSLNYLAVPEPSSALLTLCGAAVFLHRRRRPASRS